jgi:NitT/TauT family transport system permease protein
MASVRQSGSAGEIGAWEMVMYRFSKWIKSPTPYLMLVGFVIFFGAWYLLSEVFKFWRFASLPGPRAVLTEWLNPNPVYGMSLYTPDYYVHVWSSMRRVLYAFLIATGLGVPFGLFLGWSRNFKEFTFPVFETLRPIPVLAWVPLAIVMFKGTESPVIFLTTLASFYATALNTMLGVQSIDESYPRAAACLGASKWQIFRHIIIPGALPFIFTGLQISVGVAWFSLVAAEMVSGEYGLGYLINTSYVNVQYPVIIIGMISVGIVGYASSALVRMAGDYMMQWRVRELALGAGR